MIKSAMSRPVTGAKSEAVVRMPESENQRFACFGALPRIGSMSGVQGRAPIHGSAQAGTSVAIGATIIDAAPPVGKIAVGTWPNDLAV